MCGICCVLTKHTNYNLESECQLIQSNLERRGPDAIGIETISYDSCKLLFAASVLWLQGKEITKQPLLNSNSVFVYNGDIFYSKAILAEDRQEFGDTVLFFKKIAQSINSKIICGELDHIHGPYAFIYYDKDNGDLYFGRDKYGRRSLLLGKHNKDESIIITSVAKRDTSYKFIELPSIGIFCINVHKSDYRIHTWSSKNKNFTTKLNEVQNLLGVTIDVVENANNYTEKLICNPSQNYLQLIDDLKDTRGIMLFEKLLTHKDFEQNVAQLKSLLENAVDQRIATQPQFCKNCILKQLDCNHSITGVLFSGGVDCAVLALLADKYTDRTRPIDLINVAFDREGGFVTPDRVTAGQTLEELERLCPDRQWNLVKVDVTTDELNEWRKCHIADLIYPLDSILDDSLGCALWFASRAKTKFYTSPCRVLLVGMGADELFGGYTRHRNVFKRNGWVALANSLEDDWQNLPHRNLGRDDRVVSDHSRQLRTPYLDEHVVQFVHRLQSWKKTWPFDNLQGIGEKILLRVMAYSMGLTGASTLKKRALQFGSRIANSKENASDVSHRLLEL